MSIKRFLLAPPIVLMTVPALAHTGLSETSGFSEGFLHPLSGFDHLLTMVTVGLFAVLLGRRALWSLPASFVMMLLAGSIIGLAGIDIPFAEAGIIASIIVLGAIVAFDKPHSLPTAMGLTGAFALFHGYAHGAEMPAGAAASLYCLGFVSATVILHGAGIVLGLIVRGYDNIRWAGAAITFAGVLLSLS